MGCNGVARGIDLLLSHRVIMIIQVLWKSLGIFRGSGGLVRQTNAKRGGAKPRAVRLFAGLCWSSYDRGEGGASRGKNRLARSRSLT